MRWESAFVYMDLIQEDSTFVVSGLVWVMLIPCALEQTPASLNNASAACKHSTGVVAIIFRPSSQDAGTLKQIARGFQLDDVRRHTIAMQLSRQSPFKARVEMFVG